MDRKRCHIFVQGLVQGVGFRNFTQQQARNLGVCGWVSNLADGRVEAVLDGPAPAVDELIKRIGVGPRFSKVSRIEVTEDSSTEELNGFELRR